MSRSISGPSKDMSCSGTIEQYRADVDGLRAAAVLAVVGFHAFPGVFQGGFIGVDIFFVISGFLISRILFKSLASNRFSIVDFYSRRIRRIFPALTIVLLFCLTAGWFLLLPNDYAQLGKHVSAGTVFISNLILWNEAGYFDQASHAKPLLHLWSLGIEEQFYLFYPIVLALIWKMRKAVGWALVFLTLASFAFNIHLLATDLSATFYSPLTRFWELSVGGLIAFQRHHNSYSAASVSAAIKTGVSLVGAGLILLAAVLLSNKSTFPGWWACLPVLGAGALLWAGPQALVNRYVFSNRILVWIGLISYPLYLWHWPLLTFAQIDASEPTTRLMRISIVVLSVLLAWLTYRFIEQPIRRRSLSKAMTSVLLSVLLTTGLLGLLVYQSSGAPARMPLFIQQLSALEFDHTIRTRVGTCFLLTGQTSKDFSNCLDEKVAGRPSVLLIGDSHASHLYPGLSTRFGHEANIIQRTAGFCPPMFGPKTEAIGKLCKDVIEYAQQLIRQQHPQVVILSANWLFYELTELKDTIQWLKAVGVEKIILVGPVPQWRESLVRQLYQQYRKTDQAEVPSRLSLGLNPNVFIVDRQMAEIATALEVEYISPQHLLCDTKGCLTRYGESLETLITWDYGHLTNGASEYLVSNFPDIK
jgi:peptidoglycan/LPS O-acetylase OafA/YrhL